MTRQFPALDAYQRSCIRAKHWVADTREALHLADSAFSEQSNARVVAEEALALHVERLAEQVQRAERAESNNADFHAMYHDEKAKREQAEAERDAACLELGRDANGETDHLGTGLARRLAQAEAEVARLRFKCEYERGMRDLVYLAYVDECDLTFEQVANLTIEKVQAEGQLSETQRALDGMEADRDKLWDEKQQAEADNKYIREELSRYKEVIVPEATKAQQQAEESARQWKMMAESQALDARQAEARADESYEEYRRREDTLLGKLQQAEADVERLEAKDREHYESWCKDMAAWKKDRDRADVAEDEVATLRQMISLTWMALPSGFRARNHLSVGRDWLADLRSRTEKP